MPVRSGGGGGRGGGSKFLPLYTSTLFLDRVSQNDLYIGVNIVNNVYKKTHRC